MKTLIALTATAMAGISIYAITTGRIQHWFTLLIWVCIAGYYWHLHRKEKA